MRSTSRVPVWASMLATATAAAALLAVAGCALDKPESQPKRVFERIGGHGGGQILQPKQCLVRVLILDRPFKDPAINEVAWRVADEQLLSQPERKALTANGLRIGRIIGGLPKDLESIVDGEGPNRTRPEPPSNLLLESGQSTLVCTTTRVPEVELLINRDDRVTGRPYRDASGYLRLTPRHDGAHAVSLRVVPEIHHGPLQRSFPTQPTTAGLAPKQLTIRDAQKEEALNELGVDLVVEEGQVVVIGSRPDNLQSLGTFLFSKRPEENAERRQRLILIWASRNMPGIIAEAPKGADRPSRLRRLVAPPDEPPDSPAPPDSGPPSIPPPPEPTSAGKKPQ